MLIQAAINGARTRSEHPRIPLTPEEQAREARDAVAAGAGAIHVHVRDASGAESLEPDDVAATLEAIRGACPGVPVGISTGAWIVPAVERRLALIRAWSTLPDYASVNVHEDGAADVIRLLLERGIGVEAGVWDARGAHALERSGLADDCLRILLEPGEEHGGDAVRPNLERIERALPGSGPSRLLHGAGPSAWPLVQLAAQRGYDTRIGFEDTLVLPDGTRAEGNAALVRAARRLLGIAERERAG